MAIMIVDPANRIQGKKEIHERFGKTSGGILYVPASSPVPVHINSVERIVEEEEVCAYIPSIREWQQTGIQVYSTPVLHWFPAHSAWKRWKLKNKLESAIESSGDVRVLRDTSLSERQHYFAEHFTKVIAKPAQVSVVLSNVCNLKCIMCPYHGEENRKMHRTDFFKNKMRMPKELLESISQQFGALQITVKMGNIEEPLLHTELGDFVSACRSSGVPTVHITTNGVLLTKEMGERLLDAGLTSLYISVDAVSAESYKRIRGQDLSVIETNIQDFLRTRNERDANCLVMLSIIKNEGVDQSEIDDFVDRWLPLTDGIIIYNLIEYTEKDSLPMEINSVISEFVQESRERFPCFNPFNELYVLPDGRVFYCCENMWELTRVDANLGACGNLYQDSIEEIWRNEVFVKLRRDSLKNDYQDWPSCEKCKIWMAMISMTEDVGDRAILKNMTTTIIRKKG
jgi:MoaA/NifB/PqqE/SkfB family radical SAM enzyme